MCKAINSVFLGRGREVRGRACHLLHLWKSGSEHKLKVKPVKVTTMSLDAAMGSSLHIEPHVFQIFGSA